MFTTATTTTNNNIQWHTPLCFLGVFLSYMACDCFVFLFLEKYYCLVTKILIYIFFYFIPTNYYFNWLLIWDKVNLMKKNYEFSLFENYQNKTFVK